MMYSYKEQIQEIPLAVCVTVKLKTPPAEDTVVVGQTHEEDSQVCP